MKRTTKPFSLLLCTVLLFSLLPLFSFADTDTSDVEDLIGVVLVSTTDSNTVRTGITVCINDKYYVLTWGDSVESSYDYYFYNDNYDAEELYLDYVSFDNSFALFAFYEEDVVVAALDIGYDSPKRGDEATVYYMDYSQISKVNQIPNADFTEETVTVTVAEDSFFRLADETENESIGGLLVCDDTAVGMITMRSHAGEYSCDTGVPMSVVAEAMGVKHKSMGDTWIVILFILIALALVGLVIYVIVSKKKKPSVPVQQYPYPMPSAPYPDHGQNDPSRAYAQNDPYPVYPQNDSYPAYPQNDPAPAYAQNDSRPVQDEMKNTIDYFNEMQRTQPLTPDEEEPLRFCLLGKGGLYDGQKFEIQGDLFMGRQPGRCQICYPADAAGISGLHCQIRISDNAVELTDLGSSYGTFVNGEKLTPNVPVLLRFGESFWLAEPKNTFVILR